MNISPSKENILKKIREALNNSTPLPFPRSEGNNAVLPPPRQELEIEFGEQFTKLQGKFIFCLNHQELAFQLNSLVRKQGWKKIYCREDVLVKLIDSQLSGLLTNDLPGCDISITSCEALVARTGSIVLSTAQSSGRTVSVYAPIHVCIAYTKQLVYDVNDALQLIKNRHGDVLPSLISFATGPSRTADIEKTLVVGVHGPKEVYCFLIDE
jgi:L-lactate dehydrogenase complex protein LldG